MASGTNFYSYTDANGVDVIVRRLADVPEQYRKQAKHIDLSKPAVTLSASPSEATPAEALGPHGEGTSFHTPSFVIGAAAGLALGWVAMLAFRRQSRLLSLIAGVVVMAALGIGYMTYVRRQARLPGVGLVTPATLLDDARAAAGSMNKRNLEQERTLEEMDKQR